MSGVEITFIEIPEHGLIRFGLCHDEQHTEISEFNFDEHSAIGLTVDLLSRLLITEEAQGVGISLGPANGSEVGDIA